MLTRVLFAAFNLLGIMLHSYSLKHSSK